MKNKNVISISQAMTPERAESLIRELSKDSSNVKFSFHAIERMEQRDISDKDTLRVLQRGFIKGEPEPTKKKNEWKCKMVREGRVNRDIGVITIIVNMRKLLIKTVEWEDFT